MSTVEPFYYPNMLEDMFKEVHEAHEDFLGQQYHVKSREDMAQTCPFLTCLHPLSDHLPQWRYSWQWALHYPQMHCAD